VGGRVGTGGVRELLVVLGLGLVGLLLAALAAFTPWYAAPAADRPSLVEVRAPERPPAGQAGGVRPAAPPCGPAP
jgi:hypothetical protein